MKELLILKIIITSQPDGTCKIVYTHEGPCASYNFIRYYDRIPECLQEFVEFNNYVQGESM